MLKDILRRIGAESDPAPLAPEDSRLALCALMVQLAVRDDHYSERERRIIEHVLAARYGVDPATGRALREEAEALAREASDSVQFTRLVKESVPYDERAGVVEALWKVAGADGINADEHGFLRLVANLVGVADVDSGLARQRALKSPG